MPKIVESIEINALHGRVWEIISNLDNEPEYWWGTREIRNISRDGNVVNREIYQNFRKHSILQKVLVKPESEVEIQYLKGLTEGTKFLRIQSLNENVQKLTAEWIVHFTGIFFFATPILSRHVRKGTKDALQRIKDVAEGRPIQYPEEVKPKQK